MEDVEILTKLVNSGAEMELEARRLTGLTAGTSALTPAVFLRLMSAGPGLGYRGPRARVCFLGGGPPVKLQCDGGGDLIRFGIDLRVKLIELVAELTWTRTRTRTKPELNQN